MKPKTITVAELRTKLLNPLNEMPDDTLVYFGNGDLSIGPLKHRGGTTGPALINVELEQLYTVTHDLNVD